ncbi:MAG TPA: hypothetical protein VGN81_23175 [Pseudonocardiaceae bacterium]|jgi:hypothetical protein
MRIALVSGDGLPVSGLLTTFRNVVDIGFAQGLLDLPIPADLGYSWRPDKAAFYPHGDGVRGYPHWLLVTDRCPVAGDPARIRREWLDIRAAVADPDALSDDERTDLRHRIDVLARAYEHHFTAWLDEHDIDWVIAVNLILPDAVPVTLGLQAAAARRYGERGRTGGILFWDHDLFGSCAVVKDGTRVYPQRPNEFTPLPQDNGHTAWAVVSEPLKAETDGYPASIAARVVSNVLPTGANAPISGRHTEFAAQRGLRSGAPLILCPVRMFRVKGVDLAVRLLAATARECDRLGRPRPQLLVFGSLSEDPGYAKEVLGLVEREQVGDDVVFLDGVPLNSYREPTGNWVLDEVDLLRLAASTGGMVFFTPNTPDVETVGLGPALASLAGLPSVTTGFTALDDVYGPDYRTMRVDIVPERLCDAAPAVVRALHEPQARYDNGGNGANLDILRRVFPPDQWLALLRELHAARAGSGDAPVLTGGTRR